MHNKVTSMPSTKFEPPPVHKMMTNNIKAPVNKKEKEKSNNKTTRNSNKTRFVGICRGQRNKRNRQSESPKSVSFLGKGGAVE